MLAFDSMGAIQPSRPCESTASPLTVRFIPTGPPSRRAQDKDLAGLLDAQIKQKALLTRTPYEVPFGKSFIKARELSCPLALCALREQLCRCFVAHNRRYPNAICLL